MGRVPLAPPMRFGTIAFPPPCVGTTESETSSGEMARATTFSECLYCGAYPKLRNLPFLETLHLRTIVSLTPQPLDSDPAIAAWAQRQNGGTGVRIIHVRTEKPKEDTGGLSREGAARAMLELLNRENLPLYVHCLDGVEVTCMLVACLRKIQAWTETSIRVELARGLLVAPNRLAGTSYGLPKHLAHFLDHYGEPDGVLLPERARIPTWVWPALAAHPNWRTEDAAFHHPSLRIHFQRSEHYVEAQRVRFGAVWTAASWPRSRTPSSLSASDFSELSHRGSDERASSHASSEYSDSRPHSAAGHAHGMHDGPGADHDALGAPAAPASHDMELLTPRARPVQDAGDVEPLTPREYRGERAAAAAHPHDPQRTPLVAAYDAHVPTERTWRRDVPPLGEATHAPAGDADARADALVDDEGAGDDTLVDDDELVDEEDEEYDDDDDDPSQVLDALDLEGY